MAEHDQRLKALLREFLRELLMLLLPAWVARFDFATTRWQEQEVFVDPPRGERRELDLVARVGLLQPIGSARETLIHVEVESGDGVGGLRERMPLYHDTLGYKHGLPVLSLGVGLEGRGWDQAGEDYWEESLGLTRWPYLGLPALDARTYVEGDNLLGVALSALMRVAEEQQPWLKARAMQRVATADLTVYQKYLLMECIDAYLGLTGPRLEEFRQLLVTEDYKEAQMLSKTTYELGVEKGRELAQTTYEQGREEGQRALLREQLEARFGPLSATASQRLEALPAERLRELGRALLRANSLAELGLEDQAAGTNGG